MLMCFSLNLIAKGYQQWMNFTCDNGPWWNWLLASRGKRWAISDANRLMEPAGMERLNQTLIGKHSTGTIIGSVKEWGSLLESKLRRWHHCGTNPFWGYNSRVFIGWWTSHGWLMHSTPSDNFWLPLEKIYRAFSYGGTHVWEERRLSCELDENSLKRSTSSRVAYRPFLTRNCGKVVAFVQWVRSLSDRLTRSWNLPYHGLIPLGLGPLCWKVYRRNIMNHGKTSPNRQLSMVSSTYSVKDRNTLSGGTWL